jgi:hypothetical protein
MNIQKIFYSLLNPIQIIDGLLHPYKYTALIHLNENPMNIKWTKRANRALHKRQSPLIIELQLHFSCLVKKHVLFHTKSNIKSTAINKNLAIAFSTVQSQVCIADETILNHSITKVLTSKAAMKMHPRLLQFDYYRNNWIGEYYI